jgi:hypothetical protein
MTVIQRKEAGGFIRSARGVAIALTLVVVGVAAGLAIDRVTDQVAAVTYEGPLVERSLAMEAFYNGTTYEGPMVKRSLAMEAFYGADQGLLNRAAEITAAKFAAGAGADQGLLNRAAEITAAKADAAAGAWFEHPLVKRSLAMEEFYNGD